MKILLINPLIRPGRPPTDFPVGLAIVAAMAKKAGHEVRVYDENALRPEVGHVRRDLAAFGPVDLVGIGGLITTYKRIKDTLPLVKELFPRAPIVLGGGVTIEPETIFQNMPVDFCVHGEGEYTFLELCQAVEAGQSDFQGIAGISYLDRLQNKLVVTEARGMTKNLDDLPMPAYELFPSEVYFGNNAIKGMFWHEIDTKNSASLIWSRGCPNECTFCWRMMGRSLRFRSMELVMREIEYLRGKYRVDSYLFYDECINAVRSRAMAFADALVQNGYAGPWYSHARVRGFDDELAQAFKRSGCLGLNFGVESASPERLTEMNKNASPDEAARAVEVAVRNGLRPFCTFIIGMPGETQRSIKASVDWICRNRVRHFCFFFATPYPGCELYRQPEVQRKILARHGTLDAFFSRLGDASDLVVNMTRWTDAQLQGLRDRAERKCRRTLRLRDRMDEYGRLGRRVARLVREPQRWGRVLRNRIKA